MKAGDDLHQQLAKEMYLYPSFLQGTIYFRNGKSNQARFNYNLLYGQMLFVGAKGDTLSVADTDSIKYMNILQDTFYYQNGYLQIITQNKMAKLALQQLLKVVDQQKIGGYGSPAPGGAITSFDLYSVEHQTYKLDLQRDLVFMKKIQFYIAGRDNIFFLAERKNLLKAFPQNKQALSRFVDDNKLDFNEGQDMIKLLEFMKNLP